MKAGNLLFILTLFLIPLSLFSEEKWVQYTNTDYVTEIVREGNYLWIGTTGGLIKFNKKTGEEELLNNINSGLPSNFITSIFIDKEGNKWIGTSNAGAAKFDGKEWEVFFEEFGDKAYISINSVTQDLNGNLWLTTDYEIIKYDGHNFIKYNTDTVGFHLSSLRHLAVDSTGNIWICSNSGVIKYDGDNWELLKPFPLVWGNIIRSIFVDNNGIVWFGSHYEGLAKFDGDEWELFTPGKVSLPDYHITTITQDSVGNIWIGTYDGWIGMYDGRDWEFKKFAGKSESTIITDIIFDDDMPGLWIGTASYRFAKLISDEFISYYDESPRLHTNYISAVETDLNGNHWIGTMEGLLKFYGNKWALYNNENSILESNEINDLLLDEKGDLWIATQIGLFVFDGENFEYHIAETTNLRSDVIKTIAIDSSRNIWIGADKGAAKYDGSAWTWFDSDNSGLPDSEINTILADSKSNIWFGTKNAGLVKFNGEDWQIFDQENSNLPSPTINDIIEDKVGNIWVALAVYLAKISNEEMTVFKLNDSGLPYFHVTTLEVAPDGSIWTGTKDGLANFDGENWTEYNISNSGLPHDNINDIEIDNDGSIWFGTAGGIAVLLSETTDVAFDEESSPNISIFPNPAEKNATVEFNLESASKTNIEISDNTGQYRSILFTGFMDAGGNTFEFSVEHLPSGMYFLHISSGGNVMTKKLVIMK